MSVYSPLHNQTHTTQRYILDQMCSSMSTLAQWPACPWTCTEAQIYGCAHLVMCLDLEQRPAVSKEVFLLSWVVIFSLCAKIVLGPDHWSSCPAAFIVSWTLHASDHWPIDHLLEFFLTLPWHDTFDGGNKSTPSTWTGCIFNLSWKRILSLLCLVTH